MSKTKEDDKARAVEMLRDDKTAAETAAFLGVHSTTVQRWAKQEGITLEYPYNRHRQRCDLIDTGEIVRLRGQKHEGKHRYSMSAIADMCGCSASYVKKVLRQHKKELESK